MKDRFGETIESPLDTLFGARLESAEVDGSASLLTLKNECDKALHCLFIAVPEDVARDVNRKVQAYIKALEGLP